MGYLEQLLAKDERPVFATRPHWTAFLGTIWQVLILLLLMVALALGIDLIALPSVAGLEPNQRMLLQVGVVIVLLIYPAAALLLHCLRWRAEQYVITNLRVIQVEGIFSKNVLDSSLEKVNDVMMRQSLMGRLLDYGDLEILTASEIAVNRFDRVARPLAFKGAMLNAKQELERGTVGPVRSVPELISQYAALRAQGVITEEEFQAKKAELLRG